MTTLPSSPPGYAIDDDLGLHVTGGEGSVPGYAGNEATALLNPSDHGDVDLVGLDGHPEAIGKADHLPESDTEHGIDHEYGNEQTVGSTSRDHTHSYGHGHHPHHHHEDEEMQPEVKLATMAQKQALWWRNVIVTGMFILSWYTFATLLSLYNKWMFSPEYYGFSYPLFVSACHMVVQFSLAATIRLILPLQFRPAERPTRRDYATKILPTAIATGSDIGLSNLSLKTITLSLYTMCKSSSLIFVLFFAFMFKLEKYSLRLVSVIGLISFGVFLMVFNTTAVSIPGIVMVFSASGLGGLRWALTELIMHKKAMGLSNPFATIFWLAPLMAFTLGVVSLIFESWSEIFHSVYFDGAFEMVKSGAIIALPGALAFAMVASEYFIIQRAGVVPLSIAGIFKEVTTITISAWVFGDKLTELNIIGVVVTVCGITTYAFHKYQKSVNSPIPLDDRGNPIETTETSPLDIDTSRHLYSRAADQPDGDIGPSLSPGTSSLPLRSLDGHRHGPRSDEDEEERLARVRDEFEGWDSFGEDPNAEEEYDEYESEADADEVARRRDEREVGGPRRSSSKWSQWWDREL